MSEWLRYIDKAEKIGLDLETHDPFLRDRGKVKARGTSVVFGEGKIIVTGLYKKGRKICLDGNGGEKVSSLYTDERVVIVGANICYDIMWDLHELGLKPEDIKCHFIDISIVESIIDEYQPYSLEDLAVKYLNEHKGKEKLEAIAVANHLSGDFRQHLARLWDLGYEKEIREYVMSDADQPCRIWEEQKKIIFQKDGNGRDLINACQMNLDMIKAVIDMKYYGARFDFFQWQKNCKIAGDAYEGLKTDYEGKYGEVNINSPKQLAVQFDKFNVAYKMKITVKGWKVTGRKFKNALDAFEGDEIYKNKKTLKNIFPGIAVEKGKIVMYIAKRYAERTAKQISDVGYEVTCNPCINKTLFAELKNTVPIVADLVQYKQAKNLVDKFLGPKFGRFIVCHTKDGKAHPVCDDEYNILPVVNEKGAYFCIHGTFNICGARQTGRLSGSAPNCLAEGTRVFTFEQGYIPIETVQPGMHIVTHTGKIAPVINVWKKGIKECIKLTINRYHNIICTRDHLFFDGQKFVKAEDVKEVAYACIKGGFTGQGIMPTCGGDISLCREANNEGCCKNAQSVCTDCVCDNCTGTDRGRAESRACATLIKDENEGKKPDVWNDTGKASGLERSVFGQQGTLYYKDSGRKSIPAQESVCGCSGDKCEGLASDIPCSPYRRESGEQQSEQSCPRYIGWASFSAPKVSRKVRHTVVGAVQTYDIEVGHSDHSFIAEGFLVHNCQQIASKTVLFAGTDKEIDLAYLCRECFIASPGHFFLKQDYAAQENRLAAHFAPGKNGAKIRQLYQENPELDEHQYAAEVSGLIAQFGAKIGRKYAKNLRFGLSYGMGIPRMMITFGWSRELADDIYQKVIGAAPWLSDLMELVEETVLKRRYIRTLIGRRIHLRRGHDSDAYAFMNYLIQGSASDMTKLATNAVTESKSVEQMLLTVHDEDDFDLPCTKAGIKRALDIGKLMETSSPVSVPMLSEPEIGTNWANGVEYDSAFGTREEFITMAVTAIKENRFEAFRKQAKAFLKKDEDDDITFAEFCSELEEDEEEETA